ncbi:MAG: hypothetical protein ABI960_06760 [Candidatus Eisenbacteria bacterium]
MSPRRRSGPLPWVLVLAVSCCCLQASVAIPAQGAAAVAGLVPGPCDMAQASPWIESWFAAWKLTSERLLRLPDAPAPGIVLFDSSCVYTTSAVTAGGAPSEDGPALRGALLPWRAIAHSDSLTLPDSSRVPIQLMSFTSVARASGPFFVMAAPSYWAQKGHGQEPGLTAVFLHEFAHTRQVRGFGATLGPIDSTWAYPEELDDDAVQTHFGSDSLYVAAYLGERDLLYRAAAADSLAEVRAIALRALAMIEARHARWFTGDKAQFATLDDIFLSLEGAGQWTGYAWLAQPDGGGLGREAAIRMLGGRRWWVQDEGLALFLTVDRLLPTWPELVFHEPSIGARDLLARAVAEVPKR